MGTRRPGVSSLDPRTQELLARAANSPHAHRLTEGVYLYEPIGGTPRESQADVIPIEDHMPSHGVHHRSSGVQGRSVGLPRADVDHRCGLGVDYTTLEENFCDLIRAILAPQVTGHVMSHPR